jgi:hypothetical protein
MIKSDNSTKELLAESIFKAIKKRRELICELDGIDFRNCNLSNEGRKNLLYTYRKIETEINELSFFIENANKTYPPLLNKKESEVEMCLNTDMLYIYNMKAKRILSREQRKSIVLCVKECNLFHKTEQIRTINEVVFAIRFGSLSRQANTKLEKTIEESIISAKHILLNKKQWFPLSATFVIKILSAKDCLL